MGGPFPVGASAQSAHCTSECHTLLSVVPHRAEENGGTRLHTAMFSLVGHGGRGSDTLGGRLSPQDCDIRLGSHPAGRTLLWLHHDTSTGRVDVSVCLPWWSLL